MPTTASDRTQPPSRVSARLPQRHRATRSVGVAAGSTLLSFALACSSGAIAGDAGSAAGDGGGNGDGSAGSGDTYVATGGDLLVSSGDAPAAGDGAALACNGEAGQIFPPAAPWNTPIDGSPLAADSAAIINYLQLNHTDSRRFQIDLSFHILRADGSPRRDFTQTGNFYTPDCDPAPVPVPVGGAVEGYDDYDCLGGDCHLLVIDDAACRLYELWIADIVGSTPADFTSGCQAVWDTDLVPPQTLRGDYCTSADASGLPITPLLFTADEVAAGEIRHAIRFILPNANIRADQYVRPGTHSTFPTSGPASAPPYASRLRLRADVTNADLELRGGPLNATAAALIGAMRTYGTILVDGGNITFTGASDTFTTAKWASLGMDSQLLKPYLEWSDFEVVDGGPPIIWSLGNCTRVPVTD